MPFPSPPWHLQGDMWLSLVPVRQGTAQRPAGLYGVAFVDYRPGSVLIYQELLVARLVHDGLVPRVTITDIWVNSQTSRTGGRSLWAIPKELADLHLRERRVGPVHQTAWSARESGTPIAAAAFSAVPAATVRTPFAFGVVQTRDDGSPVRTGVSGSARIAPCTGGWRFGTDGPLAWLAGRRRVMSLRLSDFRLTFGG